MTLTVWIFIIILCFGSAFILIVSSMGFQRYISKMTVFDEKMIVFGGRKQ